MTPSPVLSTKTAASALDPRCKEGPLHSTSFPFLSGPELAVVTPLNGLRPMCAA